MLTSLQCTSLPEILVLFLLNLFFFFPVNRGNFLGRLSFSKEEVFSVLSISALISAMQAVHKRLSLLPMK